MLKINLNDREFLQQLEEEADRKAGINGLDPFCRRALLRLADATCEIDAYLAREFLERKVRAEREANQCEDYA